VVPSLIHQKKIVICSDLYLLHLFLYLEACPILNEWKHSHKPRLASHVTVYLLLPQEVGYYCFTFVKFVWLSWNVNALIRWSLSANVNRFICRKVLWTNLWNLYMLLNLTHILCILVVLAVKSIQEFDFQFTGKIKGAFTFMRPVLWEKEAV
jgi:hypothetical protein